MRILIAPDKFKSRLSADRVAVALTRGARTVHPEASFSVRPIADGGEGTVDAFVLASGGRVREVTVSGPLGQQVEACVGLIGDGEAVIEMAGASGLSLVEPSPDSASHAHTLGTGQLLLAAVGTGASRIVMGVGGSSSTDGGTGAARAWGWRFLDSDGTELPLGGAALVRLASIEPPAERSTLDIIGACDVDNPLTGDDGAARVFSAQKGADPAGGALLGQAMDRLAEVIRSDLGLDVSTIAHGGAGGGMGAGLVAFFGAKLRPGLEFVAEATGLEREMNLADLVVTGEGRLDSSSMRGKAPVAIARMAKRLGKPCIAVVGDLQVERTELRRNGIEWAVGLLQTGGGELAESDPERAIEKAIEGVLRHKQEKKQGRSIRR